jgi:hypothetical protein
MEKSIFGLHENKCRVCECSYHHEEVNREYCVSCEERLEKWKAFDDDPYFLEEIRLAVEDKVRILEPYVGDMVFYLDTALKELNELKRVKEEEQKAKYLDSSLWSEDDLPF